MNFGRILRRGRPFAWAAFLMLAAPACHAGIARCELLHDGVEYRAFLPGQNRYIYADIKVQPGAFPAVYVIVDKNYLTGSDADNRWWLDRSRPLLFSSDTVKVSWKKTGTWTAVTSLVSERDTVTIEQAIPGLNKTAAGFTGTGSHDSNAFAFQIRLGITDLDVDEFDVALPSINFDGVTLAPPLVHFSLDDTGVTAKC